MITVDRAMQSGAALHADRRSGQKGLFDALEEPEERAAGTSAALPDVAEWDDRQRLAHEKEVLGFYLSSHPLAEHEKLLTQYCSHTTVDLPRLPHRSEVVLGGMLSSIKVTQTRSTNAKYAMFDLEDLRGSVRCILWSEGFANFGHLVEPDATLVVRGAVDRRPGTEESNVIVNELIPFAELNARFTRGIVVRISEQQHPESTLDALYEILRGYPGNCELQFEMWLASGSRAYLKSDAVRIDLCPEMRSRVDELLGPGNVRLVVAPPAVAKRRAPAVPRPGPWPGNRPAVAVFAAISATPRPLSLPGCGLPQARNWLLWGNKGITIKSVGRPMCDRHLPCLNEALPPLFLTRFTGWKRLRNISGWESLGMSCRHRQLAPFAILVALFVLVAVSASQALAQSSGTGNVSGANGVIIDADGVLRLQHFPDPGGQLVKKRIAEARANLNPDVAKRSDLRKVSLNRLEAAVRQRLANGELPTDEMAFLAGLTRVRYVFFYPDTHDIVLAGPAEAWVADASGRVCGIESGRPALQLQDLIVALRAFPSGQQKARTILCSIDPTPEGLARLQQFWSSIGRQITPADTEMIVNGMRTNLGMQNVRIGGISADTHFAQVLLECDYRMKLIGIGLEAPPVKMATYVDRAKPSSSKNALGALVLHSRSKVRPRGRRQPGAGAGGRRGDAGDRAPGGCRRRRPQRQHQGKQGQRAVLPGLHAKIRGHRRPTARFRRDAQRDRSGGRGGVYQSAGFLCPGRLARPTFNDERALPVETYKTPLHVESVCTAVFKGNTLMTPVGGGVTIRAQEALRSQNLLADEDGQVTQLRESIELKDLPADRWWWD